MELVPSASVNQVISTWWVFCNKFDVLRNKTRLVQKGYSQQEDKNFDETYAHVA